MNIGKWLLLLREYSRLFLPQTCAYKREFRSVSLTVDATERGQFHPNPGAFKRAVVSRSTLGWGETGQVSTGGCADARQARSQELLSWYHLTCQPCFLEPEAPEMPYASLEQTVGSQCLA